MGFAESLFPSQEIIHLPLISILRAERYRSTKKFFVFLGRVGCYRWSLKPQSPQLPFCKSESYSEVSGCCASSTIVIDGEEVSAEFGFVGGVEEEGNHG